MALTPERSVAKIVAMSSTAGSMKRSSAQVAAAVSVRCGRWK
jgi:hypothetical protein